MPIPANELNPADRAILESLKVQGDSLNSQTRVLRGLADNLSAQAREFRNLRRDFDTATKTFDRGNRGIDELKKTLKNIFRAQGNTGTRVQMSGGAPDRGFFNNLFTKIFGPSKYQVRMMEDISLLKDSSERMERDVRAIRAMNEEPARRRERELLAQAIADRMPSSSSGGGLLSGLTGVLGGVVGGLITSLGVIIGGAITGIGGVIAAAIGGILKELTGLFSKFFGGGKAAAGGGPSAGPAGGAPVPPTGGTAPPGESPKQLPAPKGQDNRMPGSNTRPGYGGSGQPVQDAVPRDIPQQGRAPTFDPGGGRKMLLKILGLAAAGLGISLGFLVGKDAGEALGSDKDMDDVMKDIDKGMMREKDKKAIAEGKTTQEEVLNRDKEDINSAIEKKINQAAEDAKETMLNIAESSGEIIKKALSNFGDFIGELTQKNIDKFRGSYAKQLDELFVIKMKVPDEQGKMQTRDLNLLPGVGTAMGEALQESFDFYGKLKDVAVEGGSKVTNIMNNNTNVDQSSPGTFVQGQPKNFSNTMRALHDFRYAIPYK